MSKWTVTAQVVYELDDDEVACNEQEEFAHALGEVMAEDAGERLDQVTIERLDDDVTVYVEGVGSDVVES